MKSWIDKSHFDLARFFTSTTIEATALSASSAVVSSTSPSTSASITHFDWSGQISTLNRALCSMTYPFAVFLLVNDQWWVMLWVMLKHYRWSARNLIYHFWVVSCKVIDVINSIFKINDISINYKGSKIQWKAQYWTNIIGEKLDSKEFGCHQF